jgi:hypothetical protein
MGRNTVNPEKKSDVDPNFEKQVNARKDDAKEEEPTRRQNNQVKWFYPPGWNGDPFDWEQMKEPFLRDKANQDFITAVRDPQNPGNSGDLIATTTQIDYLMCMERAFRARMTYTAHQMTRPNAQQIGRKRGHGGETGTFKMLVLEYVRGVLKQAGG